MHSPCLTNNSVSLYPSSNPLVFIRIPFEILCISNCIINFGDGRIFYIAKGRVTVLDNCLKIESCIDVDEHINELATLLTEVVQDGASIGFLPPLKHSDAVCYWKKLLNPDVILFVAKIEEAIAGSVQLHLCSQQNGRHRAEIAKLMTRPSYRRKGVGRLLMEAAHETASKLGRTLLVLDTREGDPSNYLYTSLGYIQGGRIPFYAKSARGSYDATIIYYKQL